MSALDELEPAELGLPDVVAAEPVGTVGGFAVVAGVDVITPDGDVVVRLYVVTPDGDVVAAALGEWATIEAARAAYRGVVTWWSW